MPTHAPLIAIVGGGPAGLMAAEAARAAGAEVDVYDRLGSVGRKFLIAGKGGLNLTHSEPFDEFVARYGPRRAEVARWLGEFDADALRDWARGLGVETFVGTSAACFRSTSRPRRCCARGYGACARAACDSICGIAGSAGTKPALSVSSTMTASAPCVPTRWCSRSAAEAGRFSDRTARGFRSLPSAMLRSSHSQPSNSASTSPGARTSRNDTPEIRSSRSSSNGAAPTARSIRRQGEFVVTEHGVEGSLIYALSANLRDEIAAQGRDEDLSRSCAVARRGANRARSEPTAQRPIAQRSICVAARASTA